MDPSSSHVISQNHIHEGPSASNKVWHGLICKGELTTDQEKLWQSSFSVKLLNSKTEGTFSSSALNNSERQRDKMEQTGVCWKAWWELCHFHSPISTFLHYPTPSPESVGKKTTTNNQKIFRVSQVRTSWRMQHQLESKADKPVARTPPLETSSAPSRKASWADIFTQL